MPLFVPLVMTAALAAADATPAVVHLTAAEVDANLAAGRGPLVQTDRFKVMMSRRDKSGEAEVHATDTDVFHVLSGSAVFVTGGTVIAPKETAPGETRGASIQGGEEQRLSQGDVVVIPAGTPHWFKSVDGTVQYFVVKVTR